MDPEDLLLEEVDPIEKLPNHNIENNKTMDILSHLNISYRYTTIHYHMLILLIIIIMWINEL